MLNDSSLDLAFQVLGDRTRRAIVARLAEGPRSVGELAQPLAISLPAVLQHLKLLESCGLVRTAKAGRVRTCRLDPAGLRPVETWIAEQRKIWEARLDRLEGFLERTAPEAGE